MSHKEWIAAFRAGANASDEALAQLLKESAHLVGIMRSQVGIPADDAIDCLTDAAITVRDHVHSGKFEGKSLVTTYLSRIMRNKCIDKMRRRSTKPLDFHDELPEITDEREQLLDTLELHNERLSKLQQAMTQLGDTCQEVLKLWSRKWPMTEIAEHLGLTTEKQARDQKYKCMKKLTGLMAGV